MKAAKRINQKKSICLFFCCMITLWPKLTYGRVYFGLSFQRDKRPSYLVTWQQVTGLELKAEN